MTQLYFAGGEIPSHRKLMTELEVPNVALSYFGLRRKVKFSRPWLIHDKFLEDQNIFLDSGSYTVNRGTELSEDELKGISNHYQSFVLDNIDRLSLVSEMDMLPLGREWIEEQRKTFYNDLPADKFLPIWHPEWGVEELHNLCDQYENIGVMATSVDGMNLAPLLNNIAQEGTNLHGVGITSVDDMYAIRWASLSSTSWISPQQYGDTIIWTGRELKRYPKKYKQQARKRFRTMFEREGFDSEKIENDDSTELLRLSIWSWQQLMLDVEKKRPTHLNVVTVLPEEDGGPFVETEAGVVDTLSGEVRKSLATVRRDVVNLPVLGMTSEVRRETNPETGEQEEFPVVKFGIRSDSQRMCNSCFLASKCPAYEADSNCAFNIPVELKTRDQFDSVQNSIIEMQVQRVAFMRFAEETEGGYADPNLSVELDRLQKMLKTKHDMEEEGFSLKLDVKGKGSSSGQSGMLHRLFGEQASQQARALPSPVPADAVIDVVTEGEWTEV